MVINFTGGGITPAQVQEMIDASLDFTTGVLNLSTATDEQVKAAIDNPDRWLFSINYSGGTYLESDRRMSVSGGTYCTIYFRVPGAQADSVYQRILDRETWVSITRSTGARSFPSSDNVLYATDIIYYLNSMNTEQLKFLAGRAKMINWSNRMSPAARFTAKWHYNNRTYVFSTGSVNVEGAYLIGTTFQGLPANKIFYDIVHIDADTGAVTHTEYESNITLTQIQGD